jgi:hypothetical protein
MTKRAKMAANLFLLNTSYKCANTKVWQDEKGITYMLLYDSLIAVKTRKGEVFVSFCGWYTRTTLDRLQAVVNVYAPGSYFQKKGGKVYYHTAGGKICNCGTPEKETRYTMTGAVYGVPARGNDNGYISVYSPTAGRYDSSIIGENGG